VVSQCWGVGNGSWALRLGLGKELIFQRNCTASQHVERLSVYCGVSWRIYDKSQSVEMGQLKPCSVASDANVLFRPYFACDWSRSAGSRDVLCPHCVNTSERLADSLSTVYPWSGIRRVELTPARSRFLFLGCSICHVCDRVTFLCCSLFSPF